MDSTDHDGSATYREIKRQQKIWKMALATLESDREEYVDLLNQWQKSTWVFSGCGTSYYLAQTASHSFGFNTSFPVKAVPASEILMFPEAVFTPNHPSVLVALSRSGTTTEIVRALVKAREEFGIPSLSVSCDLQSAMSMRSDYQLKFPFEREDSVVMTGSFTTMLISILYLAAIQKNDPDFFQKLQAITDRSEQIMNENEAIIREISAIESIKNYVFLGQGPFFGLANEAALKMQEMSLSLSQSFHSLEYRHGPMSTANHNTFITIICSQNGRAFDGDLVKDLKKLGSKILVLGDEVAVVSSTGADYQIVIPDGFGDSLNALMFMPLLQLLGYYKARARGLNPDHPRNLTAVVELNI
ncbi:MAG: glucosamine-6-phosphate deaminase [Calditrichia bacterium]